MSNEGFKKKPAVVVYKEELNTLIKKYIITRKIIINTST